MSQTKNYASRRHQTWLRLVIETTSPLAINDGGREDGFDASLVRDANDLPMIPASAIAGVWQSLAALNPDDHRFWFGSADSNTGQASRLSIGCGYIHNSENQPVKGIHCPSTLTNDTLLTTLLDQRPHHRERVKINDRGVAEDGGKFDQIVLPTGMRFSITLNWWQNEGEKQSGIPDQQWNHLLSLWNDRRFTLGSNTRNGLGQFIIVAHDQMTLDLHQGAEYTAQQLTRFRADCPLDDNGSPCEQHDSNSTYLLAEIPLKGLGAWRCGQGEHLLGETPDKPVAMMHYSERRYCWKTKTWMEPQALLTASSIKGALAHRLTFHYHRHAGVFAEALSDAEHWEWNQRPDALKTLLGYVETEGTGKETATAGRLWIDDAAVTYKKCQLQIRTHNRIDRFTGGVMTGALFSEEIIYEPKFTLKLWLMPAHAGADDLDNAVKLALRDTLNDLQNGLLPLGAGASRGTGLVDPPPNSEPTLNLNRLGKLPTPDTTQGDAA